MKTVTGRTAEVFIIVTCFCRFGSQSETVTSPTALQVNTVASKFTPEIFQTFKPKRNQELPHVCLSFLDFHTFVSRSWSFCWSGCTNMLVLAKEPVVIGCRWQRETKSWMGQRFVRLFRRLRGQNWCPSPQPLRPPTVATFAAPSGSPRTQ